MTVFLRLLAEDDKPQALLAACKLAAADSLAASGKVFEVEPEAFSQVPGSPFAYWVSEEVRNLFKRLPNFESDVRIVRQGGVTGNDERYLRLWWETNRLHATHENWQWMPFAKGGPVSRWYSDFPVTTIWDFSRGTFGGYTGLLHRPSEKPSSADHYFKAGLTWPLRAGYFAPVPLPKDSIFSIRGYAILSEPSDLLITCALCNSIAFDYIFKVALGRFGFPEFVVGVLQNLPLPPVDEQVSETLTKLMRLAWSLKRTLDTVNETSHAFLLPAWFRTRLGDYDPSAIKDELAKIQAEIDAIAFDLYDFTEADREAVVNGQCPVDSEGQSSPNEDDEAENAETDHSPLATNHCSPSIDHLLSWAIGVAFGRFDPRLAEGVRPLPAEPEPFDPLPPRSPGMMPDDSQVRAVLVDDPGHRDDITAAVLALLERVDIADALRPSVEACRAWLGKAFFPLHIKMYSKSRRKAPIYWQLATPSAGYSVWLYLHGFSKDTLYQVQNDYAAPKLGHEERKLEALRTELGASPTAAELRSLAEQELLVEELRGFLEEVKRVAPLWNPNLDDGVVITSAPLWRLFPQQKAWQKELKATWDSLCDGAYDWAHLAMQLWPERVVPQCVTDRSFAIAHGLEDLFWVEDYAQRWRPRVGETETTAYLAQYWHCASLAETLAELETFWQGHANDPGSDNPSWWEDLASGVCDDHPLALALWPTRVLEKCLADEKLFKAHGLTGKTLHGRGTPLEKLLRQYPSRHSTADLQRLAAFCGLRGSLDEWSARWANFAEGNLDQEPLALRVHTLRVVEQAKKDYDFAVSHDLALWFWLTTPLNSRRLSEPKAERDREIRQRESLAVKAALLNLLDASQPSNAQRTPKQKRYPA